MLNLRKTLFVLILALSTNLGNIIAQSNEFIASTDISKFSDYSESLIRSKSLDSPNKKSDNAEELAKAYDAKVADDFGVYFNPISHSVKIKMSNKFEFTKIQITDTDSGQTVQRSLFDYYDNVVDLSKIDTGNYMIMLTDDKSNIYSESFSIVK